MQDLQLRDHRGGRQGIVQKAAGDEAAVLDMDEPFVQGRTDRHGESAAHLAVEQGRVQNSPGVVQAHILVDENRAGITVDFDPAEIEDEAVDGGTVDLAGGIGRSEHRRGSRTQSRAMPVPANPRETNGR